MKRSLIVHILILLIILTPALALTGCGSSNTLELSGTIEATQTEVGSEVSGKVIRIEKHEGDSVKKGDVLAVLDQSMQELTVKQQQAIVDVKTAKLEELKAGSQEELLRSGATAQTIKAAEAELEQSKLALEQARLVLDKYQIRSSADGIVSVESVNVGDLVNTGADIATISDPGDLWVYVFVPQKYLSYVCNGQELELRVKALGDGTIKGRIIQIAEKAEFTPKNIETEDAKENTVFRTKIRILEKTELLRPGMTLDAIIPLHS